MLFGPTFLVSDGDFRTALVQELLTPMVEVVDAGRVACRNRGEVQAVVDLRSRSV
jgi:hypothetical protein